MPQRHTYAPRGRMDGGRKPHPMRSSVEELSAYLGVDPAVGLSPKEAAKRLSRDNRKPLYRKDIMSLSSCVRLALREPVLWMLLAVSGVSLFFDRIAVGVACLLLTVGHAVLCGWLHHRAERVDAAMQTYDAPLARVWRNRRVVRITAEGVVKGDVILLYPGDVVPADVRLLSSHELTVQEHRIGGSRNDVQILRLPKDAEATPEAMTHEHSPENMIFAGAEVVSGTARALVVAVGDATHLGAMSGGLPPARTARTPEAFRKARKYVSLWNLFMAFMIVPVTAVGIFTLGSRFELLDLFLTSLALAVTTLTEHLMARGLFMGSWMRARAAEHRDKDNAVDIKSSRDLERLGEMTHLILMGSGGLHDGRPHPETLLTAGQSYAVGLSETDGAAVALAQKLYLFKRALLESGQGLPPAGTAEHDVCYAVEELCQWADPDEEALRLRVADLTYRWGEAAVTFHGGTPTYLRLTSDFSAVDDCATVTAPQGVAPFGGNEKYEWYHAFGHAVNQGKRVLFLISEQEGVTCAEGMLALAPAVCRKNEGCIHSLEAAGICVTAFSRRVSDENTRVFRECGLTAAAPAARPPLEGERPHAYGLMKRGVRAFEGCDTAYVEAYIEAVRENGGRVGVLSVDDADRPLLSRADVAFTCAPDLYGGAVGGGISRLQPDTHTVPDGRPDGDCATDLTRRMAHVIVRRSGVHGGGVCGVRQALLTSARFAKGLRGMTRFLLLSQILRLMAVLVPVILGLTLLPAPALLLSGLAVDMAVVICYVLSDIPDVPDRPRKGGVTAGLTNPFRTFRRELITVSITALLPWAAVGIATLMSRSFGSTTAYFAFLCLIVTQLAVFLTGRPPKRGRITFLVTLLLVCLYVGGLAAALSGGLDITWALAWPFLQPLAFLLTHWTYAVICRIRSSDKGKKAKKAS